MQAGIFKQGGKKRYEWKNWLKKKQIKKSGIPGRSNSARCPYFLSKGNWPLNGICKSLGDLTSLMFCLPVDCASPLEQRTGRKPTAPHNASRQSRPPRTGVRQVLRKAQSVGKLCQEGHEVLTCAITREFGAGSEEFQACKLLWPAPLRCSIRRVAA